MLRRDADVCCILDRSFQFLFCNPAWDDFARRNGGSPAAFSASVEGRRLPGFIPDVLKPFFLEHLRTLRTGGAAWFHQYECSSPREYRVFELQALHLHDEDEILICHAPVLSRPHTRIAVEPRCEPGGGPVLMCCHCRCTGRDDGSGEWDWIPAYVAGPPPDVVHELCPQCEDYYRNGGDLNSIA